MSACKLRLIITTRRFTTLALLGTLLASTVQLQAQPQEAAEGKQYALLIGVERYQHVPPLHFIQNDVYRLAETLRSRGDFVDYDGVQALTDRSWSLTRSTMQRQIENVCRKANANDRVLVYFSGHGFRGPDGQLYLAPVDCKADSPQDTGLSIQWVREQFAQCKAGSMLLILDACHAGAEKETAASQELGEPFRELPNVVTIASSKGAEPSQLWDEKEQSLFSYWLCQALAGHADANGDVAIDIDELYNYVHTNVTRTAKRLGRQQTPVRIVRSGTEGVPVVVRLRPQSLDGIIKDIAQEIAWSVEENKLDRMAVFEFTEDTALGKVLGAQFGLLGRYCAAQLQQQLLEVSGGNFRVADQARVEQALQQQKFSVDDLGKDDALKSLSEKVGGLAAISLGTFQNRIGRDLGLRCRLVALDSGDVLSFAGGRAKLNDSEWAMLGGSGWLPAPRSAPQSFIPDGQDQQQQEENVKKLDEQTTHPLRDPRLPFRVRIMVGGRERQGIFERNPAIGKENYVVALKRGEVYTVRVENYSGQIACLRLLVDGLNTLPEKYLEKGISTVEVAPRVNLSQARHWVLDPNPPNSQRRNVWGINGFVTETGVQGKLREFKVVDAESSVAARKSFTDQIGLITAAFYRREIPQTYAGSSVGSARPGAGTGFGEERQADLRERTDVRPGDLWAVINIRYVLDE